MALRLELTFASLSVLFRFLRESTSAAGEEQVENLGDVLLCPNLVEGAVGAILVELDDVCALPVNDFFDNVRDVPVQFGLLFINRQASGPSQLWNSLQL